MENSRKEITSNLSNTLIKYNNNNLSNTKNFKSDDNANKELVNKNSQENPADSKKPVKMIKNIAQDNATPLFSPVQNQIAGMGKDEDKSTNFNFLSHYSDDHNNKLSEFANRSKDTDNKDSLNLKGVQD